VSFIKIDIIAKDSTGPATDSAKQKAKELETAVSKVNKRFKALALTAVATITFAVNSFANFEKGITEISTLMGETTDTAIVQMGQEIKSLAVEFGQTIQSMTSARYDVVSAGFKDAADSAEILTNSAKLATAGVAEVSATADVLTSVLNAYGKQASESARVSDILFKTVELGKTRIDLLASGLGRVISIAPTVGVSFEEVSASVATLTAIGQSTDEAVTALGATMTQMLSPSDALQKRLKELGFETGVQAVKTLGFSDTLKVLTEGINEAELAARFPNVRAMRAVFPLIGEAADKFSANLADIQTASGSVDKAFEKIADTTFFQLNKMKESVKVVIGNIGKTFAPLLEMLARAVESFAKLSPATQLTTIGLGVLIVSIKALAPLIAIATAGTSAFSFSLSALGTAIKGLFASIGPAGWIIAGVSALIPLVISMDNAFADTRTEVEKFQDAMDKISTEGARAQFTQLETKLDETIKKRDELVRKLASQVVLEGKVEFSGTDELRDINAQVEILQGKMGVLKDRASEAGTEIQAQFKTLSADQLANELVTVNMRILKMRDNLQDLERVKATALREERSQIAGQIDNLNNALGKAVAEQTILNQLYENLDASAVQEIADAAGDIDVGSGVNIPFTVDPDALQEKYTSALKSLERQQVELTAKANLEIVTTGAISEDLNKQIEEVAANASALKVLIRPIEIDTDLESSLEKMVDDFESANEEIDNSDKTRIDNFINRQALLNEKRIEASKLLEELSFRDSDNQILELQKRFDAVAKYADDREALEVALQERLAEIRAEAAENERQESLNNVATQLGYVTDLVSNISSAFSNLADLKIAKNKKEQQESLKTLDKSFEKQKKLLEKKHTTDGKITEQGKSAIAALEERHQARVTALKEEGQEKERQILARLKPIKVAQSLSNTALAVTKALASAPPPINYALASAVGLAGAAQTAVIAAQPFQEGAILDSRNKKLSPGQNIFSFAPQGRDTIPAVLEIGEAVIPAAVVRQHRDLVENLIAGNVPQNFNIATDRSVIDTFRSLAFENGGIVERNQGSESFQVPLVNNPGGSGRNVTVNLNITSNSLNPEGARQAIEDLVRSDEFIEPLKQAINDREIFIEVDGNQATVN